MFTVQDLTRYLRLDMRVQFAGTNDWIPISHFVVVRDRYLDTQSSTRSTHRLTNFGGVV